MSFNHWRYRILHWTFNVPEENINERYPEATGLPKFLYTHYCPLFHLTNLIAILSPLIFGIKCAVAFFAMIGILLRKLPLEVVGCYLEIAFEKLKAAASKNPRGSKHSSQKTSSYREEKRLCMNLIKDSYYMSVDEFLMYTKRFDFKILKPEDLKSLFEKYSFQMKTAVAKAKLRKEKWRQRLIFWTNFSRVFIKWAMNLFYVGLALLFLYIGYSVAIPIWWFICWVCNGIIWMFSDSGSLAAMWVTAKILFFAALGLGIVVLSTKIGLVQRLGEAFVSGFEKVSAPLYILFVPFGWIKSRIDSFLEFAAMFYEENCPPVKLVNEEEAVIESVAKNGEEV